MTSGRGIAAVSLLLVERLQAGLAAQKVDGSTFVVSARPLELLAPSPSTAGPGGTSGGASAGAGGKHRLNLALHRVKPNTGWVQNRLPSRTARDGRRVSVPQLAIDLHYILSAHAQEDYRAEELLGCGMLALHERPVITREEVKARLDKIAGPPTEVEKILIEAKIPDQVEELRIAPDTMDPEAQARLWSATGLGLRPSATYQVSLLLMERERPRRPTFPVTRPARLEVEPLLGLHIERVLSRLGGGLAEAGVPITHARRVVLQGTALGLGGGAALLFDGDPSPVTPVPVSSTELAFDLKKAARPGVHGVQVVRQKDKKAPSTGKVTIESSNLVALVVHPSLAGGADEVKLTDKSAPGGKVSGKVTVKLAHEVAKPQTIYLQLDGKPGSSDASLRFRARPLTADVAEQVVFDIEGVPSGKYLVRVEVDAATSQLRFDDTGFTGPLLEVTP